LGALTFIQNAHDLLLAVPFSDQSVINPLLVLRFVLFSFVNTRRNKKGTIYLSWHWTIYVGLADAKISLLLYAIHTFYPTKLAPLIFPIFAENY
jgi:hypothetical protein